ncbi:MAG: hypothetical protein V3U48_05360 [Rhodospirillales bacterium]
MPAKDTALTADEVVKETPVNRFFERLPEWVIDTLSPEQKEAIHQAAEDPSWGRSPVNIRFTLPFLSRKYYITVVGGSERRSDERRAKERHHYPLRTLANIFFFVGLATVFYVAAVIVLALQTAIVEF